MRHTHPSGDGPGIRYSAQLLGEAPSIDRTAGYPVHRVEVWKERTLDNGLVMTDWRASCGHTATEAPPFRFGSVYHARADELCPACWHAVPGVRRQV